MKILKLSDFIEKKDIPPILLGGFFGRRLFTEDSRYIYIYTAYKESKKIETKETRFKSYNEEYIKTLNDMSGQYPYWFTKDEITNELGVKLNKTGKAFFLLENDLNVNRDSFYNKLYAKLVSDCEWVYDEQLSEDKKSFIRGYMELRGSIDTKLDYIAQDYFYDSEFEFRKARMLVDYLSIPLSAVNINFRELQQDYYKNGKKRNTQLRLNVWWYMRNIGIMNKYKAEVFAMSRRLSMTNPVKNVYYFHNYESKVENGKVKNELDLKLNFYSELLNKEKISGEEIKKMREELKLDPMSGAKTVRSRALVETVKYFNPDECVCCKDKYNIKDRSFITRNTGRYYFEVHHVISIGSNKTLDDENNMVKLCPVCHRMLKRGSGIANEQKELIRKIFNNAPQTLAFASHFFDTGGREKIIDLTYDSLK